MWHAHLARGSRAGHPCRLTKARLEEGVPGPFAARTRDTMRPPEIIFDVTAGIGGAS
jgi:hypothetical protein